VPKLYFKERALEMVLRLGEMLAKMAAENGVREITVVRGELRSLLNKGGGRSKDLISMALRRFVIADSIQSSGWRMEIVDRRKPIIHLKLVNHDG